jgi:hypothetical protein
MLVPCMIRIIGNVTDNFLLIYSGWCMSGNNLGCSQKAECDSSWNNNSTMCPMISTISPSRGPVEGKTKLSITSNGVTIISGSTCVFYGPDPIHVIPDSINGNTVVCPVPPKSPQNLQNTITVTLEYKNKSLTSNSAIYTYYGNILRYLYLFHRLQRIQRLSFMHARNGRRQFRVWMVL